MKLTEFRHRGVVEGFYGPPWSHEDRCALVEWIGDWGMNRFVYAPKDDPLHRESWRDAYPGDTMREFAELIERGGAHGVDVGFAISPGCSIRYATRDESLALVNKLMAFHALGSRFFCLALDDVPSRLVHDCDRRGFDSLAEAHVELAHRLRDGLSDATIWLVPTDYLGVAGTDYLEILGETLDASIEVAWTGRTVVSPDIAAKEAAARAATLRRAPLLWDNVPVADGSMRSVLHLGPYMGRDPELPDHTSGVMLNPMQHPRASAVSLFTAARYLADPAKYDPESAWQDAIATLGAGAVKDFAYFAHAHRFSVLAPDDRDGELQTQLGELRDAIAHGHDPRAVLDTLCDGARARAAAGASLRASLTDRRLLAEIEPWIESHGRETRRIEIALNAIRTLCGEGPQSEKTVAFLAMEGRLTRAPESALASYGPRRAVYPQLDSMRDESMAFGADQALFIDHCLADEFVVLAEQIAREQLGAR